MNDSQTSTLDPTIFLQLQEEERQRLAHALMSGPGQVLANTFMEVEYALPLLEKNPQVALAGLSALRNELRDGLAQLKELVAELQPPLLEEMGLGVSVQQYVQTFGERTGMRAECRGSQDFHERYPRTIELALFRVLQEALANVRAHAKATNVRVELAQEVNQIRLTIQDNGRGFVTPPLKLKQRPLGLIAMRDRVELLSGQLQLFSEPGRGVRLVATIPYHGHGNESKRQGGQPSDERTNHQPAARARESHNRQEKESTTGRRPRAAAGQNTQKRVRRQRGA